jgi:hypothetical protein
VSETVLLRLGSCANVQIRSLCGPSLPSGVFMKLLKRLDIGRMSEARATGF